MIARPPSGQTIDLTDDDLARIGLVAVLEAQASTNVWVATKALCKLDGDAWAALQSKTFKQLMAMALPAAELRDAQLSEILMEVERLRGELGWLRNAILHATWAVGPEGKLVTRDWHRKQNIDLDRVDEAIALGSKLSITANAAVMRIADLIEDGIMLPGSTAAPAVGVRSRNNVLVRF